MAEDSPQNSLGHQEASEDFNGITNEKFNNSMKENTILDKNQCGEEYDLTVIVPHGIGRQKPGDTFALMYESISDNFNDHPMGNCDSNCENDPHVVKKFWSGHNTKKNTLVGVDIKIPQGENRNRYVALRESYWHPTKDNEESAKLEESAPWYKLFLGVIQILLLKILQFRLSIISFMLVTSWILVFSGFENKYNIPQGVDKTGWEKLEPFTSKVTQSALFPFLVIILTVLIFRFVGSLYIQIKSCTSGSASRQASKVMSDIKEALKQSHELMIIAHSMGGYLSYESLHDKEMSKYANREDGTQKNVSLVGLGSGLGPMMIIQKVKGLCLCKNIGLVILLAFFLYIYFISWTSLLFNLAFWVYYPTGATGAYVVGFSNHGVTLVSNFFWEDLAGTHPRNIVFRSILFLILIRINMKMVVYPFYSEFASRERRSISFLHREFYYSSDIVGNTSRFVYPKNIGQELLGDPILGIKKYFGLGIIWKRFIYSHNLGYYFQSSRLVNFLWNSVISGIKPEDYASKDSRPKKLQVIYFIGFSVALCVGYLIYANSYLTHLSRYSYHYSVADIIHPIIMRISLTTVLLTAPLTLASCWVVYFCTYFMSSVFLYIKSRGRQSQGMLCMAPTLLDEKNFNFYALVQLVTISFVSHFASNWIIDFIKSFLSRTPYGIYAVANFLVSHFWTIEIILVCLMVLRILVWEIKETIKHRYDK